MKSVSNIYSYFEKGCVGKNVHASIPKVTWNLINTLFLTLYSSCRTYFFRFLLALANMRPWPLVTLLQISLKNNELKTTHNTLRDCHVHFCDLNFLEIAAYYVHNCVLLHAVVSTHPSSTGPQSKGLK